MSGHADTIRRFLEPDQEALDALNALLAENQRLREALKEALISSLHDVRRAAFSPQIGVRYSEPIRLAIAAECQKLEEGITKALAGGTE